MSTCSTRKIAGAAVALSQRNLSKMIVLNLVRHGETEMNKADIVQSRTPGDLTERGINMAQSLGIHLKDEKFDRVFTSDLKRCHDTTLNILKHSNTQPPSPVLMPILRERDYGDLEFQPGQTIRDLIEIHGKPNHAVPIPGGESHEAVMERCAKFFEEICQLADQSDPQDSPKNILAVSHGAWINCFLDYLALNEDKFELRNYHELEPAKRRLYNTGRTKIEVHKVGGGGSGNGGADADGCGEKNNNEGSSQRRPLKFHHIHCVEHYKHLGLEV